MDLFQIVVLALIQGITEFLPISSSAHLILPSQLLGWPDQGLAFDVAVHVGTLAAVVIYFRSEIGDLVQGWFAQFAHRRQNEHSKLAWAIVIATIPAGLVGLVFNEYIEVHLRSVLVIAITTIAFGLLLWLADERGKQTKDLAKMTFMAALIIGLAQALALIPGTSRSGITITMALFLGFTRTDAARFSFLMSIPVIALGGMLESYKLTQMAQVDWMAVILGTLLSGVSAYLCIHYFLSFISRLSMKPFVVYRLILGGLLLAMVFAR